MTFDLPLAHSETTTSDWLLINTQLTSDLPLRLHSVFNFHFLFSTAEPGLRRADFPLPVFKQESYPGTEREVDWFYWDAEGKQNGYCEQQVSSPAWMLHS